MAPDAFDIIDVGVVKGLTNDQRRNLGSVAKILQFAASNKGVSSSRVLLLMRIVVRNVDGATVMQGSHLPRKPGKLLEFYVRPGIFGIISRFTLVLTF